MRPTQIVAAAALAAPLAFAVPAPAPPTSASNNVTTNLDYITTLRQVKERYPDFAEEDANIAALGYLQAVRVQGAGRFSNITALFVYLFVYFIINIH
jgi:hypothetical protein